MLISFFLERTIRQKEDPNFHYSPTVEEYLFNCLHCIALHCTKQSCFSIKSLQHVKIEQALPPFKRSKYAADANM